MNTRAKRFNKVFPYLLILPSFTILMLTVVYPIINSLARSFRQTDTDSWGLGNYTYFFTDPMQRRNIGYTLWVVVITVFLAVLLGYLLAVYLRFSKSRVARWLNKLYIIPRFIPGLVAVNGIITIISDSGLINRISRLWGGNVQLGLMYDARGIIMANIWFNIPFAAMLLMAGLEDISDSQVEAARDVGADKLTIFRKLLLPLTYKDILIAVTFIFMSNIGSFTTPYLMGAHYPQMLGIVLFNQFNSGYYERAAALSVIMFLISAVSAVIYIYSNMKEQRWNK